MIFYHFSSSSRKYLNIFCRIGSRHTKPHGLDGAELPIWPCAHPVAHCRVWSYGPALGRLSSVGPVYALSWLTGLFSGCKIIIITLWSQWKVRHV